MPKIENETEKSTTPPSSGSTGRQGGGWSYQNVVETLDYLKEQSERQKAEVLETIINKGKISGGRPENTEG